MGRWWCKNIVLYLAILLFSFYPILGKAEYVTPEELGMYFGLYNGKDFSSKEFIKGFGYKVDLVTYLKHFYGYWFGIHFSDNNKIFNYLENDSVYIKFAGHNQIRSPSFYEYYRGDYKDLENIYAAQLGINPDRDSRTLSEHDIMFMQLSAYWGKVEEHAIPIGSCKSIYKSKTPGLYRSLSARAFLTKDGVHKMVCVCLTDDCNPNTRCLFGQVRCKKVKKSVDPPPFCSMLDSANIVSITPLKFSKQTFFRPGVRIHIYSGSGKPYVQDLYAQSYKIGDKTSYDISYAGIPYKFQIYKAGYDIVCAEYINNGVPEKKVCLPSPGLVRPKITPGSGGIHIQYQDCQGLPSCDVDVSPGTKDSNMFFSVIKPKVSLDDYTLVKQYECEDGQVVHDVGKCSGGSVKELGYASDNNGNVTCVVDMPFVRMKYSLKKNNRDLWLNRYEKMFLGYGVVTDKTDDGKKSESYVMCDYESAINIANMQQEKLDKVRSVKQDVFFDIAGHYDPKGSPCVSNVLYKYDSTRFYKKGRGVSCKDGAASNNLISGFDGCSSLYDSDDDFTNFFHEEDSELDKIKPLNPILQGMCVSNFPSYSYGKRSIDRKVLQNAYKLSIDKKNSTCDFLKIEAWGGGASGMSRSGKSGRPGNYVMGILKFDKSVVDKKLIIDIGTGGTGSNHLNNAGGDTIVKLCDDDENCTIKLVANGGGADGNYLKDNSEGVDKLIHYRFATGLRDSGQGEILIPYQSPDAPYGKLQKDSKECNCNSNTLEKNSNKYFGAGGCSSIYNCAQEGANGMVKLTCEKWSGSVGKIKLIDENSCSNVLTTFIEKVNKSTDSMPDKVKEFLGKISDVAFCRKVRNMVGLITALHDYFSVIDTLFSSENISEHGLPGFRRKLLTELSNEKVQLALKELGIYDDPETILLYIDAINFNYGINTSRLPKGLLNYYVADDKFDYDLSKHDVGYSTLPDDDAMMFNVVDEDPEKWFSVKLQNQQFVQKYGEFIDFIHKSVTTDKNVHKKNNIVVSWMYNFFGADKQIFDSYAAPFVELMLGIDLDKFMKWKQCGDANVKLFDAIGLYKDKLPVEIQEFIEKISNPGFCVGFSGMTLLSEYVSELESYMSDNLFNSLNKNNIINRRSNKVSNIIEQLDDSVGNNYRIFRDVGISNSIREITLLIDAVVFNYVMSKLNIRSAQIDNVFSLLSDVSVVYTDGFPYDTIVELLRNSMKYGQDGVFRTSMIGLWSYTSYYAFSIRWSVEYFKSFVKLLLGIDLKSVKLQRCDQDLVDLFDMFSTSNYTLSSTLQDFVKKTNDKNFCKKMLQYPELGRVLLEYKNILEDILYSSGVLYSNDMFDDIFNDTSSISAQLSDIMGLRSRIKYLLNDPAIYAIFTDVGITNTQKQIPLIIDAVIFNTVALNTITSQSSVRKLVSFVVKDKSFSIVKSGDTVRKGNVRTYKMKLTSTVTKFPESVILELWKNANNMQYGNHGNYRTNIIAIWSCMLYLASRTSWSNEEFESFVNLMLEIDVKNIQLLQCDTDNELTNFLKVLSNNTSKLPLKLQSFAKKINEKRFCEKLLQLDEFRTTLLEYMKVLQNILYLKNLSKYSVDSVMRQSLDKDLLTVEKLRFDIINLLNDKTILKVFTDIGINGDKEEIALSIDAVIFNAFVKNESFDDKGLNALVEELGKSYNTYNSPTFFPASTIFRLKYDAKEMSYVHRTNIVALWSCMLTILPKKMLTRQSFINFVKLTLDKSLDSEYLDPCNQLFSEFITYYHKVGKNGNLPEKVMGHLNAIKQGKICAQLSALSELPKFADMLEKYTGLVRELMRQTFVERRPSNPEYWVQKLKTPYDFISDFTYQPKVYRIFADNGIAVKQGDIVALFHAAMLGTMIDSFDWVYRSAPKNITFVIYNMYRFNTYGSVFDLNYHVSVLFLAERMRSGSKIIPLAYYAFSMMGWDVEKFRNFAEYVSGIRASGYEVHYWS